MRTLIVSFSIASVFLVFSCDLRRSNELLIPLPGIFRGEPLLLAETAANTITINEDIVPSKIEYIGWSDRIIVAQIHPMKPRNKYSNDSFLVPDLSAWVWYILDITNGIISRTVTEKDFKSKLYEMGGSPESVKLRQLYEAKQIREKELGFIFTSDSVRKYVAIQSGAPPVSALHNTQSK